MKEWVADEHIGLLPGPTVEGKRDVVGKRKDSHVSGVLTGLGDPDPC